MNKTQTIKILSKLREFIRFFSLEPHIFAKNNDNFYIIQKIFKNQKNLLTGGKGYGKV